MPTIRELYARDKRLLRAILCIVIFLNAPVGKYVLYPCMLFSTWIHESFHGLAGVFLSAVVINVLLKGFFASFHYHFPLYLACPALSIGGRISWLNVYPDGSGLAYTIIPIGKFQQGWVASAGYQGTAVLGGIMLMFRRTNLGARIGTCALGMAMLFSCILFIRNLFGIVALVLMGITLALAGWRLPPFWAGELFALLGATTCLNAITSIRVLFFVSEATIGGVLRSSDATSMQNITKIHSWIWASMWMMLAFWMTAMGIFITVDTKRKESDIETLDDFQGEGHPLALSAELS